MSKEQYKVPVVLYLKPMLEDAERDPLKTAQAAQKLARKENAGHLKFIRNLMATGCAIFQRFEADEQLWKAFEAEPFFDEIAHKPQEVRSLASVILYVFDAKTEAQYNRCRKYAPGLEQLMEDGVDPRDIPKEIEKRGGIDELYEQTKAPKKNGDASKARAASEKAKSGATIKEEANEDATEDDELPNNDNDWSDDEENEEDIKLSKKVAAAEGRNASKLAREAVDEGLNWFLVQLSTERLDKALSVELDTEYWLKLKNIKWGNDGLVRVQAVKFSRTGAE